MILRIGAGEEMEPVQGLPTSEELGSLHTPDREAAPPSDSEPNDQEETRAISAFT